MLVHIYGDMIYYDQMSDSVTWPDYKETFPPLNNFCLTDFDLAFVVTSARFVFILKCWGMWRGNQETTGVHPGPAQVGRQQREQLHQWRRRDCWGGHLPGGGDRPAGPRDGSEWRAVRICFAGEVLFLQAGRSSAGENSYQTGERGPWRQTDPTSNWVSVTVSQTTQ